MFRSVLKVLVAVAGAAAVAAPAAAANLQPGPIRGKTYYFKGTSSQRVDGLNTSMAMDVRDLAINLNGSVKRLTADFQLNVFANTCSTTTYVPFEALTLGGAKVKPDGSFNVTRRRVIKGAIVTNLGNTGFIQSINLRGRVAFTKGGKLIANGTYRARFSDFAGGSPCDSGKITFKTKPAYTHRPIQQLRHPSVAGGCPMGPLSSGAFPVGATLRFRLSPGPPDFFVFAYKVTPTSTGQEVWGMHVLVRSRTQTTYETAPTFVEGSYVMGLYSTVSDRFKDGGFYQCVYFVGH